MEKILADINGKLDGILASQKATELDMVRVVTRLDIFDERGTLKSVKSIGELHEKINASNEKINNVEKNNDRKIIAGLAASVLALLAVAGGLIQDSIDKFSGGV